MECRVLFVEDEFMVRQNVQRSAIWKDTSFVLAGLASNGEDALALMEQTPIDILVTDIKMPFMDGLALAGTVRERWPATRIIILSGYDDFSYAQRAIQLGVNEYLVKPFKASDLLAVLEKERERLEAERTRESQFSDLCQAMQQARQRAEVQKLLMQTASGILSNEAILNRAKALGLHWEELFFAGAQLCTGRIVRPDLMLDGCTVFDLQDTLRSALGETDRVFLFSRDETTFQLLLCGENRDYIAAEAERVAQKLLSMLKDESHSSGATAAIGRIVDCPADISISFADAQFALSLHLGQADLVYATEMKAANIRSALDMNAEKQLIHNLLYFGGQEDIRPALTRLSQRFQKANASTLIFLHFSMEVLEDVHRFLEECGLTDQSTLLDEQMLMIGRCSERADPPMFFSALGKLLEQLISLREQSKKHLALIAQAQTYVKKNYVNPRLSLNEIAKAIGISAAYFSTLFRQETGQNLVEYITLLRMEEAKRLLKHSEVRTTEIAYAVGYNDPNYFSKTFKKIVGISPREYRTRKEQT